MRASRTGSWSQRALEKAWGLFTISLLVVLGALAGCDKQPKKAAPTVKASPERRLPAPLAPPANTTSAVQDRPAGSKLPFYELKMEPKDLLALERNPFSNDTHPATFIADGEVYERIRVRYRGAFARSWPKKAFKIFLNQDKPFQGQLRLNLNSGWRDPAFVRETLAYEVYAACEAPASRSQMVRLHLNGQFRGLYVEVEQPDKTFVGRLNLKGASIYKASSRANVADERDLGNEEMYRQHYEKETQKAEGHRELQRFCQELARTTDTLDFFTRRVDLDKYINYLAASALMQNWDGYNKNHFIVQDSGGSKKWFVLPWDLDRTFGDYWDWSFDKADLPVLLGTRQSPGITGWNRMADRFFSEPTLRSRFFTRLEELLEKEFTTEKLFPLLDRLEADIGPEAILDRRRWPSQTGDLHSGVAQVRQYIERRRAYLLKEVPRQRRNSPTP